MNRKDAEKVDLHKENLVKNHLANLGDLCAFALNLFLFLNGARHEV
ncbi:MAG: hypothetical protein H7Y09_00490 [Chitinophagaceae bacterium]|nr:hypothetical protein [Anaerolineae bacterium]